MARYRYLGQPQYPMITGPCTEIRVRKKDGTKQVLTPIPPATEFAIGQDIGYDITDSVSIKQLDVDNRFEKIS